MAGHSHAKNIMHKKNAQDFKKAKIYVRISKIISTAIKLGGPDEELNYKLKHALKVAQQENVPKHVIQKALDNTKNQSGETVFYEAYFGPIAILIQINCTNKNKTAANIREILSKNGAKLAQQNSVFFLFEEKGIIECEEIKNIDQFNELAIELNALEINGNCLYFSVEDFYNAQIELEKKYKITSASIEFIPKDYRNDADSESLYKLLEKLEEYEEVESCWHNFKL